MSITIQCQCSRVITVSEELAGQPTRCPSCGRRHLIPQVRRPEVRKADLSGRACRDCRIELVKGADFCHQCGLPASTPQSVVGEPVTAPAAPAAPAPAHVHIPQIHVQHIAVPIPHVHAAAPPQMASPFRCCTRHKQPQQQMVAQPQQQMVAQPQQQGPFAAAMKPPVPVSGLARVSMTCAYIAILLSMFTVLAALPMAHHLYRGSDLAPNQAHSLMVLIKGMGAMIGLFAFSGLLTGFLGLFHFGRRRAGAALGLVLCFVVGSATAGSIDRMQKRYAHVHHLPTTQQECEICPCPLGCPGNCPSDAQPQEVAPQTTQPSQQAAPTAPAPTPDNGNSNGIENPDSSSDF
ncbi:MAG: hypothetical protein AB7K09_17175 [Planctomycetota bacterium]